MECPDVPQTHLGYAIFVAVEDDALRLRTYLGGRPTNTIYMEKEAYKALLAYVASNPELLTWRL